MRTVKDWQHLIFQKLSCPGPKRINKYCVNFEEGILAYLIKGKPVVVFFGER